MQLPRRADRHYKIMKQKVEELCGYCGIRPAVTRDHVIAKCLFPKDYPVDTNRITVGACEECNTQKKSKDDSYLRDMIAWDPHNWKSRLSVEGYMAALRSAKKGKSEFCKELLHTIKTTSSKPLYSSDGNHIGYSTPLSTAQIERQTGIFKTIVHGMYYARWEQLFPKNYILDVLRFMPDKFYETVADLQAKGLKQYSELGSGTCTWRYFYNVNDPANGCHLFSFQNVLYVGVITNPKLNNPSGAIPVSNLNAGIRLVSNQDINNLDNHIITNTDVDIIPLGVDYLDEYRSNWIAKQCDKDTC